MTTPTYEEMIADTVSKYVDRLIIMKDRRAEELRKHPEIRPDTDEEFQLLCSLLAYEGMRT